MVSVTGPITNRSTTGPATSYGAASAETATRRLVSRAARRTSDRARVARLQHPETARLMLAKKSGFGRNEAREPNEELSTEESGLPLGVLPRAHDRRDDAQWVTPKKDELTLGKQAHHLVDHQAIRRLVEEIARPATRRLFVETQNVVMQLTAVFIRATRELNAEVLNGVDHDRVGILSVDTATPERVRVRQQEPRLGYGRHPLVCRDDPLHKCRAAARDREEEDRLNCHARRISNGIGRGRLARLIAWEA